jgi:hypothetical protein
VFHRFAEAVEVAAVLDGMTIVAVSSRRRRIPAAGLSITNLWEIA